MGAPDADTLEIRWLCREAVAERWQDAVTTFTGYDCGCSAGWIPIYFVDEKKEDMPDVKFTDRDRIKKALPFVSKEAEEEEREILERIDECLFKIDEYTRTLKHYRNRLAFVGSMCLVREALEYEPPTCNLKPGDRVRHTPEALRRNLYSGSGKGGTYLQKDIDRIQAVRGTVKRINKEGMVVVLRDGLKTPVSYHPSFWEKV